MCNQTHYIFFNICTHIQMKYIPTINPACDLVHTTYELLPNSACPKCLFWTEFKLYEYDTWEWGVSCGGHNGVTMSVVGMNLAQFEVEWEEDILGLRRKWFSGIMQTILQGMGFEDMPTVSKRADKSVSNGMGNKVTTEAVRHTAMKDNIPMETVPRGVTQPRTSQKRTGGRNKDVIRLRSEE